MKLCVSDPEAVGPVWENGDAASTANEAARTTAAKRSRPGLPISPAKDVIGSMEPTLDAVRDTKPEFWRSLSVQAIGPVLVYDGPLPTGPRPYVGLAPVASNAEYVYMFFDAHDRLLYVGRSWRPADRFTKHRRKPWWGEVAGLAIVKITGENRAEASAMTDYLERLAIKRLRPLRNIAGVA